MQRFLRRRLLLRSDDIAEIDRLVAERVAARAAKDYTLSDKLRDELAARGVEA